MKLNRALLHAGLIGPVLFGLGSGCGDESLPSLPPDYGLGNTVFSSAPFVIEVSEPPFGSTTDSTPTFTWVQTGQRFVFLGVFSDNIDVRDGSIVNVQDNVWAWHSGLGTARDGAVAWADGRDVVGGILQMGQPPTPLVSGRGYVWAVWAWDDQGLHVTHSSTEMFFMVE